MKRDQIVERQGRSFVLFGGLLDAAHEEKLKRVETQLIQIGHEDNGNCWIFKATVETDKGTFSAHGDATPANVGQAMRMVLPRMAETRAVARALRFATNSAMAALEELADDEDSHPQPAPRAAPTQAQPPRPIAPTPAVVGQQARPSQASSGNPASEKQINAIYAIARKRGLDEGEIAKRVQENYGVEIEQLSSRDASQVITDLNNMVPEQTF